MVKYIMGIDDDAGDAIGVDSRKRLSSVLESGTTEEVQALIINALFQTPKRNIVAAGIEVFAVEFNNAYDGLSSPGARLLVQEACASVLRAVPWRHAPLHRHALAEILSIAQHVSSLGSSRYLYEFSQRTVSDKDFAPAWLLVGDLIIGTVVEPIAHEDVQAFATKLFFDIRFEDFALMIFFRLAEIAPSSCMPLFPRFLELLSKFERQDDLALAFAQKRFIQIFDLQQIATLLRSLEVDEATELADQILSPAMKVETETSPQDERSDDDLEDEPGITTKYYISFKASPKRVEVNPVPFIRREIRRAHRDPNYFSELPFGSRSENEMRGLWDL